MLTLFFMAFVFMINVYGKDFLVQVDESQVNSPDNINRGYLCQYVPVYLLMN